MSALVSVIVPTYNEADNVEPLVRQLEEVLGADGRHEVIFVDDSTDETPQIIDRLAKRSGIPVRLLHRSLEDRCGGLSGAVVAGMQRSQAATVVVMDGDLQHPPNTVPLLLSALEGHDVAIASRYCDGGAAGGLKGWWRCVVSRGATWMARALFPRRLRACSDPMTGFFAVRLDTIELDGFNLRGSRLLDRFLPATLFRSPKSPSSSVSVRRGSPKPRYGKEPVLRGDAQPAPRKGDEVRSRRRNGRGCQPAGHGCPPLGRAALHLGQHRRDRGGIASNFVLQERFVFPDRRTASLRRRRAWQSFLFNNIECVARLPLLVLAVSAVGLAELPAQFLTLVLTFGVRFAFMSHFVYRKHVDPSES